MTRIAVLGDIHGNLPALEAVMADMARFSIDAVVANGDVINWGPFSAEVLRRIRGEGWAVIRGNHEFYLLDYGTTKAPSAWSDPSHYPLLPLLQEQLGDSWTQRIAAWPDSLSLRFPGAKPLRIVHGSPRSAWEPLYAGTPTEEVGEMLAQVEEETVVVAHTHLPLDRTVGRWRILNPGSVGVPLDGVHGARYMLLESSRGGWEPTFRYVQYDYEPLYRAFDKQRFVERCGIIGHLVVEEFKTVRPRVHPFLMWRTACCPERPISIALLADFAHIDPWDYTSSPYHINVPE